MEDCLRIVPNALDEGRRLDGLFAETQPTDAATVGIKFLPRASDVAMVVCANNVRPVRAEAGDFISHGLTVMEPAVMVQPHCPGVLPSVEGETQEPLEQLQEVQLMPDPPPTARTATEGDEAQKTLQAISKHVPALATVH